MDFKGETVAGYRIEAPLATGGFAHVFSARGPGGEDALVKVGRARGGSPRSTRGAFAYPALAVVLGSATTKLSSIGPAEVDLALAGEARLLRETAKGILPRLVGEGKVRGRPALVLERLAGPSLTERFRKKEKVPPATFVRLLEALDEASRLGLAYHGDLKPDHVFLGGERPRFIDPAYRTEEPGFYTLTPEYNPLLAAGPMADTTAVVAMLYEALSGERAFPRGHPAWALHMEPDAAREKKNRTELRASVPKLRGLPGVPEAAARVVEDALDALLLDPRGGDFATPAKALPKLRALG